QEKYDPASAVPLTMQKTAEGTGAGSAIGGVPGTSSNVPSAKSSQTSTASTDPGASSTSESATYGVNRTMRRVVSPAGRIRRVTAAVVVDDAIDRHQEKGKWVETRHKRSPEEIKLITELSQAAIGYDSTRGDVISVQNLTFNHTEADDIAPTTWVDKARKGVNDYSSIIRYGALFGMFMLVYLLMIRPIQKKVLATSPQAALTGEMMDTPALPNSPEDLAARSLALKKQLTEFVRKEPETSTTAVRAWLREGV
ncbi:MAG TPA: flagellar M-ring protein FliF C-terminal domain-containing protein, partial [Acidobacteriaceae bacterium]